MAEAQLGVVANPLINITLQGRHDGYPKRRGMTRVPELMAAGLTVAFGHDCALDPWYAGGSADMLEAAHMGLHVGQMTSQAAMRACFDAVTQNPARLLGLQDYGLAPGCHADFVLLHARSPAEGHAPARGAPGRIPARQKNRLQPRAAGNAEPGRAARRGGLSGAHRLMLGGLRDGSCGRDLVELRLFCQHQRAKTQKRKPGACSRVMLQAILCVP